MYKSIQALRAVAAILVVVMHHLFYYDANLPYLGETGPHLSQLWYFKSFGGAGVHLFFVISGFVMALVARSKPNLRTSEFVRDRVIRIVPLYWIVTFVWIALQPPGFATIETLVRSLLFIPGPEYFPLLGVGWTLNYEMFFYALFAIVAVWLRQSALWLALPLGIATVLPLIVPGHLSSFYGALIIWDFFAGIVILNVHRMPVFQKTGPLFFWFGVLALLAGIVFLDPSSTLAANPVVPWGIPCAAVVLGAVSTESARKYERVYGARIIQLMGESSYALYLIHPALIVVVNGLMIYEWRVQQFIGPDLTVVLLTAIMCMAAIVVHKLIERPLTKGLKWAFSRGSQSSEAGGAPAIKPRTPHG